MYYTSHRWRPSVVYRSSFCASRSGDGVDAETVCVTPRRAKFHATPDDEHTRYESSLHSLTHAMDKCRDAARAGDLQELKRLHEAGVPWDFWTCVAAAEGGHLSCLQYAHENGCDWNSLVCEHAIDGPPGGTGGHMNCLTYAVSNGCRIDELTCAAAAEGGHLECLRFLHENECPWDDRTTYAAARHEHPECLKFAFENGCPLPAAEDERVQLELKPGIVTTIRFGKV